ncbi:MAG TPA: alpha-galactosidase [Verrucomicrobiales bacterium]|nr:alpha-galactosidase [Verrucomicrobiales bacterium]
MSSIMSRCRRIVFSLAVMCFVHSLPAQRSAGYILDRDWLIQSGGFRAQVSVSDDGKELVLENGLVRRVFRLEPNAATVALDNLMTGTSLLRAVKPEASVRINGESYSIGGLSGQPNHAYLAQEWLDILSSDSGSFQFVDYHTGVPVERFPWKRNRYHAPDAQWPPAGVSLRLDFKPNDSDSGEVEGVKVSVHYELYDGIPAFSKWLTVENAGNREINLDSFTSEILAIVPYEDPVEFREGVPIAPPELHVETDYAFGGFSVKNSIRHSVHWIPDPEWNTQVNYLKKNPCLLEIKPTLGPDQSVSPGEIFTSFRTFELVYDSTERERKGLALRKLYRTIAPWVTENPLILHVVSSNPEVVRHAIDQAEECGFEMVSLSFGSGLNMENENSDNYEKFRILNDYAAAKGIHLGGYSLLSSRRIKPDSDNIVNPETGKPGGQTHGFCPALASEWGQDYFRKLKLFFSQTGFRQFTHDGSYPGDFDAAARLPLQKGLNDSQWVQWKIITEFYQWLRAQGVYIRVPDYYFLSGANESGMGYREVNWSLPRLQQQIHTRQNIYDGTWQKTPSMGWMFVPLTQYHGGGAAATIEPLDQHLEHYEIMMASNWGAGVQAVYRGHRLFDTDRTRNRVKEWVDWYRTYRGILESDIIHSASRRADGRGVDWFFHANPKLKDKGMLVAYNATTEELEKDLKINLYYTGLKETANFSGRDGKISRLKIDPQGRIQLRILIPPKGVEWFVFR